MGTPVQTRLIYSSSNGDDWLLCYDAESERAFVQHVANAASGGHITERDIGDFLGRGPHNPEHHALLRMIGSLADTADATGAAARPESGSSNRKATRNPRRRA